MKVCFALKVGHFIDISDFLLFIHYSVNIDENKVYEYSASSCL